MGEWHGLCVGMCAGLLMSVEPMWVGVGGDRRGQSKVQYVFFSNVRLVFDFDRRNFRFGKDCKSPA